jgi:hypothetical protein
MPMMVSGESVPPASAACLNYSAATRAGSPPTRARPGMYSTLTGWLVSNALQAEFLGDLAHRRQHLLAH